MSNFAVIENGIVVNIIVADSLEIAESLTGLLCFQYDETDNIFMHDKIDDKKLNKIKAEKNKRQEEIKKAEAKAEADRVKAIEAENERLRALEAERVAAEEAAKPKSVTGIFVKVEKN